MTDTPTPSDDIQGLGAALDTLVLSAWQKALLTAIVSMAADVVRVEMADPVPSFREQFAAAFTPEQANFLINRPPHSIESAAGIRPAGSIRPS